jgi:hypothetical protein
MFRYKEVIFREKNPTKIYLKVKVKWYHYRPGETLKVQGDSGSQISRQSAH